jgi:Phosphotransferase enzyme family
MANLDPGEAQPLPAGRMTSGIVRRGDRIWRPMGPWSPAVHEYLRHLELAGFGGAPRVLGIEGDREVLTHIEGEVAADPQWQPGHGHRLPAYTRTDEALTAAARLLRDLHDAAAGWVPASTRYRSHPHPPLPGEIICHGDLGPWNTVYRAGLPVAFIDWDAARPADPLTDLADAAWAFVPLAPPGQLAEAGFERPEDMPARLRRFVTGYGLADPAAILPELANCLIAGTEGLKDRAPGPVGAADVLEHTARRLRWIDSIRPELARALGA